MLLSVFPNLTGFCEGEVILGSETISHIITLLPSSRRLIGNLSRWICQDRFPALQERKITSRCELSCLNLYKFDQLIPVPISPFLPSLSLSSFNDRPQI